MSPPPSISSVRFTSPPLHAFLSFAACFFWPCLHLHLHLLLPRLLFPFLSLSLSPFPFTFPHFSSTDQRKCKSPESSYLPSKTHQPIRGETQTPSKHPPINKFIRKLNNTYLPLFFLSPSQVSVTLLTRHTCVDDCLCRCVCACTCERECICII